MKTKRKFLVLILCCLCVVFCCVMLLACGDSDDVPPTDGDIETKTVSYSEFGAKGDGETDDFSAIKATHTYANEHGYNVKADDGATYYIGLHKETVTVKTDTDFGNAKFTIDDSVVPVNDRGWDIFDIAPDAEGYNVRIPSGYSLNAGQKNIGLTFEAPVMLYIVNSDKKDYIRYGLNTNSGSDRQEVILVDKQGNVDKNTPVLWDYDTVTSITAYSVSDKPITVQGGEFTTIANVAATSASYYARGINIRRSNTVLANVKHYVTGEQDHGSPYTGFYSVNSVNNVVIDSCLLCGHKTYINIKPTGAVSQGTYDTQAKRSNNVKWLNCDQANSITDTAYWGVMSSNFCKNLQMEGCYLSRFDAHQGVYNATVRNTVLGQNLTIIGAGTLLLENVTRLSGDHFIQLRQDYGSTWNGDVIIKDCELKTASSACSVIKADWVDWNFGYTCYLPKTVTLDGFTVEGAKTSYVFSNITGSSYETVQSSENPYVITEKVIIGNESTALELSPVKSDLLASVRIERN